MHFVHRMISPILPYVLAWAAVGGTIYWSCVLFENDYRARWIALALGLAVIRVLFEVLVLAFKNVDQLGEDRDALCQLIQATTK